MPYLAKEKESAAAPREASRAGLRGTCVQGTPVPSDLDFESRKVADAR
jgi:hypothetical protein